MWFFKNIKARTLWIATAVVFVITIGLIVLLTQVDREYNTVIVVFMIIGFVLMTFLIQAASYKSFKFKAKKTPVVEKEYQTDLDIISVLRKNKYKERDKSFGVSFLKVSKPNAFKVSIVTDIHAYYEPQESDNQKSDKELDACDRMIGIEIFENYNPEDLEKFRDYSLQGKNIYYTCLYRSDDNKYICPNYLAPDENHKRNYDALFEELGLKEIVLEEESSNN